MLTSRMSQQRCFFVFAEGDICCSVAAVAAAAQSHEGDLIEPRWAFHVMDTGNAPFFCRETGDPAATERSPALVQRWECAMGGE